MDTRGFAVFSDESVDYFSEFGEGPLDDGIVDDLLVNIINFC